MKKFKPLLREYRSFLLFLFLLMVFRTTYADWSPVPSGSMEPTIYPGDVLLVDKTTFGPSLPFLNKRLFTWGQPERGDIITFIPPHEDVLYVKRVMAIPGDRIRIEGNAIHVNGIQLAQSIIESNEEAIIGIEYIAGNPHGFKISKDKGMLYVGETFTIPEGKYFVMGDNRNGSLDSRSWGFVDEDQIQGKVSTVAISFSSARSGLSRVAVPLQ